MADAPTYRPVYKALHRPLTVCGVDRRLFFLALLLGAATFNLFYSFAAGLLMFTSLYAFALVATRRDQETGRIQWGDVIVAIDEHKIRSANELYAVFNIESQRHRTVLIGEDLGTVPPEVPAAMERHTQEARERGFAFVADPSQQLARMSGEEVRQLIDGAAYLLTNDYEKELLESKTGLSDAAVLDRVGVRITTLGKDGVSITGRDIEPIRVPVAREVHAYDPTGVGDGFRAGFFAGRSWGLDLERSAQVGTLVATLVLETVGTQEYVIRTDEFLKRLAESYDDAAAEEVGQHLS